MVDRSLLSERGVLISGKVFVIDCETIEQSTQFQLLEHYSDAAHDARLVRNQVVSCGQHHVATRGRHIPRESVQLQVVLACEVLQLLTDYLTLDWQPSWRVDDHCQSCCLRSAHFFEPPHHLFSPE